MSIRLSNIRMNIEEPELALLGRAARALKVLPSDIEHWRILRKSLDGNGKAQAGTVNAVVTLVAEIAAGVRAAKRAMAAP